MGRTANAIVVFLALLVAALVVLAIAGVLGYFVYSAAFPSYCVAVIPIEGEIATSSSDPGLFGGGTIGSDDIAALLKEADENSEVKAVVIAVNSPGGSVVASREIYDAVKGVNKPTVAFFHEVAASGGYYSGVAADEIVSDPDSITGSIGARATFEDMSGLFQKIGYNMTIIKSGELKDMGDPSRPLTEKEKQIMQAMIDEIFGEFKDAVWVNRQGKPNFSQENFNTVLDARIITGRQALRLGLVDSLGSRNDAVKRAAVLANMTDEEPRVCVMKKETGFWEQLSSSFARSLAQALAEALKPQASGQARISY